MGHLEHLVMNSHEGPVPVFYKPNTDDGIGITNTAGKDLNSFTDFMEEVNPAISFSSLISNTTVIFLDTTINYESFSSHNITALKTW